MLRLKIGDNVVSDYLGIGTVVNLDSHFAGVKFAGQPDNLYFSCRDGSSVHCDDYIIKIYKTSEMLIASLPFLFFMLGYICGYNFT